ncbi:helix-turn-helix domain-containing protein [Paenibacillus sp. FSL H7-0703]|uniref:helix-turn-helix domain-containing protein n=1 Tax=Paenibacillus sp. FSL H7-0703 TaxID=2921438 RepID=UPI0030F63531
MIKRQYRSGGQIKERQRSMGPKLPGSSAWDIPTPVPDLLLDSLNEPIPKKTVNEIRRLAKAGVSRSDIAKQVGVSKMRVIHELSKKYKNKFAPKDQPKG